MGPTAAQRRFLDAAVDAFADHGFGGTSTRDIAERASRSPAALYVHYESKEAVLHAVSLAGHLDSLDCLEAAHASTDDPSQRLHRMVRDFSTWHMENARLGRVVQYELHALADKHRAQILDLRRRFHRLMVDALESGVREGVFRVDDIEGVARALLSLCIDLVRWFEPGRTRGRRSIARLNADLALRIAGAPVPVPEGADA